MKALHDNNNRFLQKIREETAKFKFNMDELYLMKCLARDLKNFREMIKLKKYD